MASIVGAARHEEELRAGLDAALVRPLAAAVTEIGRRAAERGEPVEPSRLALLGSVLEAFWWQRYTAAGDGAMTPDQVEHVVDEVLLPIAVPAFAPRRGRSRRGSEPSPGPAHVLRPAGVGRRGPRAVGPGVRGEGAALHLAEHPVGRRHRVAAVRSGSAPRCSDGRCPTMSDRPAAIQTAATSRAADSGSAGAVGLVGRPRRRAGPRAASSRPGGPVRARRRAARPTPRGWRCTGAARRQRCEPTRSATASTRCSRRAVSGGTDGSRVRTAVGRAVHPRRAPVEEELFLRREVVEHRLDGDVGLARDVGDGHGVEAAARRTFAARPTRISSRVCAFLRARRSVSSLTRRSISTHT